MTANPDPPMKYVFEVRVVWFGRKVYRGLFATCVDAKRHVARELGPKGPWRRDSALRGVWVLQAPLCRGTITRVRLGELRA